MATCQSFALLASAARTALTTSADLFGNSADGVRVIVDVTAQTATPAVTVTIQGKDVVSGKYYDLLVGTAITDVTGLGVYTYTVYPHINTVAGVSASNVLPGIFRIKTTVGDTDSMTYAVNYELLRG